MNEPVNPPRWAVRFLQWVCPTDIVEEIEGDLIQQYVRDRKVWGERKANRRFVRRALCFARPGIVMRNKFSLPKNNIAMLQNYFLLAKRNLLANKGHTGINVLSLVVGVAAALVMLTLIRFERSFDRFHTNAHRIYRIVQSNKTDDPKTRRTGVAYPLPFALKDEIPAIENIVVMQYYQQAQLDVLNEKGEVIHKFREKDGIVLTQPSFFEIFDFQDTSFGWISGNPAKALAEPFSIVLTRAIAKKYYGDRDPLGMTLRLEQMDFRVTGVVEDLPQNTDFPFTVFISYSTLAAIGADAKDDWWSVSDENQCFVLARNGIVQDALEKQIHQIYARHAPPKLLEERHYRLQGLPYVHQESSFGNFNQRTVSEKTILVLSLAGIVLFLAGCINYVNLATAQSALRSKEVGIRKVLGGNKRQLFQQFLTETFLVALLSCMAAAVLADLFLKNAGTLLHYTPNGSLFLEPFMLKSLLAVLILITVLAGSYPAMILSGFNPLTAIKNNLHVKHGSGAYLRKGLVVFQFAITQVFLICTLVVITQLNYFKTKDLGFEKDAIIHLNIPENSGDAITTLKEQLLTKAAFVGVSGSSSTPAGFERRKWTMRIVRKGAPESETLVFEYQSIDPSYLDLYGIKLVAGRNFQATDSAHSIIINETLQRSAGFVTAEDAVGEEFIMDGKPVRAIGVVKDFHASSLREATSNLAFAMRPNQFLTAAIKVNTPKQGSLSYASLQHALKELEDVWSKTFPAAAFEYQFFDENIAAYYQDEDRLSKLSQILSVVFLIIACLGLYGLMSFVVDRKMKEVCVRKVMGASIGSILMLISKDYLKLILTAFVVAVPVACYFMNSWLSTFAFHISISWFVVLAPMLIVVVVAFFTVAGKLLKAAKANPATLLKYE